MKFDIQQHEQYCVTDLNTKKMYVCIINQQDEIVLHKNINTNPDTFMIIIQSFRKNLVVGEEMITQIDR